MNEVNTPPVSCQHCGAIQGKQYWRHPEIYHHLSENSDDGYMWYTDTYRLSNRHYRYRFTADVQVCAGKLLCQDCRKPYKEAAARNEKIAHRHAKLESAGQKRLPGF